MEVDEAKILVKKAILKTGTTPPELDMAKIDAIVAERYKSITYATPST